MGKRTNEQRAARAQAALKAFKAEEGETYGPDFSEDITDLLADLHHYLVAKGIVVTSDDARDAMENMLASAANHFWAETSGKDDIG